MPWQQYVADVSLEIDPVTGRLVYDEVGLTVPRQSGKSTLLLAKAVHRASATKFFGQRQRIVYTAQTRQKAREKWEEDYAADLEASKVFASRVNVHKAYGNEHIRFANGSRFGIEANTEKAGHGGTIDEAYIDEAFSQVDSRMQQAFRPAMITRSNKQLWWVSTAGWIDGSPYLQSKVDEGRSQVERDVRSGLAYFEWSAPQDADPFDPDVWRACMPALGYTITEDAMAAELRAMGLNDFKRAYLNQWVPKDAAPDPVLPGWPQLADRASKLDGSVAFGVDMTLDQGKTSIAAAGRRPDALEHVEVVANRPGTGWVVPELVRLSRLWGASVVIDPGGPAGSLVAELEASGVRLVKVTMRDLAQACGALYLSVVRGTVRHLGDPVLDRAVADSRKRPLSDAWAFDRRAGEDASPLLAVALARHGTTHAGPSIYEDRELLVL